MRGEGIKRLPGDCASRSFFPFINSLYIQRDELLLRRFRLTRSLIYIYAHIWHKRMSVRFVVVNAFFL